MPGPPLSVFGGIGRLEYAPTSAPDDPFPVYVDITVFVRTETVALSIAPHGSQTELETIQPTQLTCVLDNTDNRFTPGLTTGPYGANWVTGKRIRYSETIGQRTFVLFTGRLEFPDVDSWQPIGYQEVQLSAVDRLAWLARDVPFVSTLAEYIKLAGAASLIAYLPMNEAAGPDVRDITGRVTLTETVVSFSGAPAEGHPLVHYATGTALPGDEIQGVVYDPVLDVGGAAVRFRKHQGALAATVAAGETLAMACWINWTSTTINGPLLMYLFGTTSQLALLRDSSTGNYYVVANDQTSGATTQNLGIPTYINAPTLVALRLTESTGLVECWIGSSAPVTFTMSGAPSTAVFTTFEVGGYAPAAFSHVQVYKGVGVYTRAMHLAQITAAYEGLEYQLTGERVNTILDYAGVAAGERVVDPGVSFMQKVSLAGRTAAEVLAEPVATERGRGFIAGDGRYVFHDRIRVLNV